MESGNQKNDLPAADEITNNSNKREEEIKLYDMEININSILGFIHGWDIKYHAEGGKDKYELACQVPTLVYSIIGNKNRGKSFILSKIANKNLPNGFSVTTKGLSLAFPKYDNGIALLDSVGFESPLI